MRRLIGRTAENAEASKPQKQQIFWIFWLNFSFVVMFLWIPNSRWSTEESEQSTAAGNVGCSTIVAHLRGKNFLGISLSGILVSAWLLYCYRQRGNKRVDFSFHTIVRYTMKLFYREIDNFHAKMWFKLSQIFSSLSHTLLLAWSGIPTTNFTNYFLILSWKFGFICWVWHFITIVYHSEFEFITTTINFRSARFLCWENQTCSNFHS